MLEGLLAFNQLRFSRTHGLAAAADFIQMGALDCRIGFAREAREEFFHQLGAAGTRQAKGVRRDFFERGNHGEKMCGEE